MSYPKYKYHKSEEPKIVQSAEEENALGPGWEETPAAFEESLEPTEEVQSEKPAKTSRKSKKETAAE